MMDRNVPAALIEDTDSSIRKSVQLFEKWDGADGGRLRYVFTPRFAGSCSMELMHTTSRIARERRAFIQSHLSENSVEVGWIRKLYPDHSSYTAIYATAGLLGPQTIMAHCIHLLQEEVSLLTHSQTSVAFCPYSNRTLRSGTMPYTQLAGAGMRIGLGSDIAGGPSLSLFRQMGEALNSANTSGPSLSPPGALYLATLGGAAVLGLEDQIGNFAPGKDADFVVIDHKQADPLSGQGLYNEPSHILSRLCYNADAHCIKQVYIRATPRFTDPENVRAWSVAVRRGREFV
jgi:guanine deaminase